MCAYNGVSAVAAARFVVSDMGDILSPKKAPDTTAPAIRADGTPTLMPTPYRARPIVAMLPKDVPVQSDMTEHSRNVSGTITFGEMKLKP